MKHQNGESSDKHNETKRAMKDNEEIIRTSMGDFGTWQMRICLLLSLVKIPVGWSQLGIVFLAAPIKFHCAQSNSSLFIDNDTLPKCVNEMGRPCTKWTYDRCEFKETIVSEWNLVCDKTQLANLAQMILMIGILVGNITFSYAADRFGRKLPVVISGLLQMITGVTTAVIPWFAGFMIFRFLQAVAVGGIMTVSFVLCMEFLGGKWRTIVATLSHIPFNIGHMTMVVIAYYTREWRDFQLAVSLPCIVFIFYIWLIPESPRWLIAVGKHEEALKVLSKAAEVNGNLIPKALSVPALNENGQKEENNVGILDLFRTRNMRKNSFSLCFMWATCGLNFYALTQYVSHIGGNIFLNVTISGLLVVPGVIVSLVSMEKFGRKPTVTAGQLLSAIACFLLLLNNTQDKSKGISNIEVFLGAIGILGCGISFPSLYLYSGEIYPTVIRNIGVGTGSVCARFGSMIAPFVASLDLINPYLPPFVIGLSSLAGALAGLVLPETMNCELPQTIAEGENFGKKSKVKKTVFKGIENEGFTNENTSSS